METPPKQILVTVTSAHWNEAYRRRESTDFHLTRECPLALAVLDGLGKTQFPSRFDACASRACIVFEQPYEVNGTIEKVPSAFDTHPKGPWPEEFGDSLTGSLNLLEP